MKKKRLVVNKLKSGGVAKDFPGASVGRESLTQWPDGLLRVWRGVEVWRDPGHSRAGFFA